MNKVKKITKKTIQKRISLFLLYAKFVKYFFILLSIIIVIGVFLITKNIPYTLLVGGLSLMISSIGILYSNSVEYQAYIIDLVRELNDKTPKKK